MCSECLISTASHGALQSWGFCVHRAAKVTLGTGDEGQGCREKPLWQTLTRGSLANGSWGVALAMPVRGTGDAAEMREGISFPVLE